MPGFCSPQLPPAPASFSLLGENLLDPAQLLCGARWGSLPRDPPPGWQLCPSGAGRGEGPCPLTPLSPQKRFRAVYDYNAADEDEVSFQDGDTIINVQQIDDGWMYGTVERTGDTGMLPANYVEAI